MPRSSLLVMCSVVLAASPALAVRPPPTSPPPDPTFATLVRRIANVREDVVAAKKLSLALKGDTKTALELQQRFERMIAELDGLAEDVASGASRPMALPDTQPPAWNAHPPQSQRGVHSGVEVAPAPMNDADFGQVVALASKQSFADDKMRVLRAALKHKPVSVAQVRAAIDLFAFSGEKLDVLAWLSPQIVDRDQRFQLFDAFTFPSDKTKADEILK